MTVCCSFVGEPCGKHGPYTFYKAFRYGYGKDGDCCSRVISLGGFFLLQVGCTNNNNNKKRVCIGELQLLWDDRNNKKALSSSRLYFLPENTPEGRAQNHGRDEVMAMSEKVVLQLDDLVGWMAHDVSWETGCPASITTSDESDSEDQDGAAHEPPKTFQTDQDDASGCGDVVVVSYPRYCRYRAFLKRLEGVRAKRKWLRSALVAALGGTSPVTVPSVRILFCRDTFHFDALEKHELLCNHLAPNLKGRPRKKRPKDAGSESNESTDGRDPVYLRANGHRKDGTGEDLDEQRFLQSLFKYMRQRNTPIERVPHLGFKQINLYLFFTCTQRMGGYEKVTGKKLWKQIYDELGGNPGSTSAATCTRRHYERLLLPYERNLKGDEDKPLPTVPCRPRKLSNAVSFPRVPPSAEGRGEAPEEEDDEEEEEEEEDFSPYGGPKTESSEEDGSSQGTMEDVRSLEPTDKKKRRQWEEFRRKGVAEKESSNPEGNEEKSELSKIRDIKLVTRATKENHPKPTLVVPPLEVAPTYLQLHQSAFKPHPVLPPQDPVVAKRVKMEDPAPATVPQTAAETVPDKPKDATPRPSVIRHTQSALTAPPSFVPVRAHVTTKAEATCPVRTVAPFHQSQSPFTFGWSLARERAPLATRDANCRDHRHRPLESGDDDDEEDFAALDLRVRKQPDSGSESPKELDLSVKRPVAAPTEILSPSPPTVYGAQYYVADGKVPLLPEYGLSAPPPYYALPVPRSLPAPACYAEPFQYPSRFYSPYYNKGYPPEWRP